MSKRKILSGLLLCVLALAPFSFRLSAHQFSTSYLQVDRGAEENVVAWQWRLVNHDLEALFPALDFTTEGKLTPASEVAIIKQLQGYLQVSGCQLAPRLALTNVISYYGGQPHLTMSGSYACESASARTLMVADVFSAINHHKVIVTNAQGTDVGVLSETNKQLSL